MRQGPSLEYLEKTCFLSCDVGVFIKIVLEVDMSCRLSTSQLTVSRGAATRSRGTGKTNRRGAKWSQLNKCCLVVGLAGTKYGLPTKWNHAIQLGYVKPCGPID